MNIKAIYTVLLLSFTLLFVGCDKSSFSVVDYDQTNDPIVKIVDVVDVKAGQDLIRVTTKSGQEAVIDKAMLDFYEKSTGAVSSEKADISFDSTGKANTNNPNLVPFLPVVTTEMSGIAKLGTNALGWIPGYGGETKGIVVILLGAFADWMRRKKNAEIAARKRGEAELSNSTLIGLSMATAIEMSKNKDVKAKVSEIMPDNLKALFDRQTLGLRSASTK